MVSFDFGELQPYVQYVPTEELREGSIYFRVTYVDDMSLIPMVDPYVFIGRNLNDDDEYEVYFQDAASYAAGVRCDRDALDVGHGGAPLILSGSASEGHVMEFCEALRTLVKCGLRRREASLLINGT